MNGTRKSMERAKNANMRSFKRSKDAMSYNLSRNK